ncbi:MAG: 30S ribosomal protein S1 [Bacteroidota bacterium]|nr:30S ribosomal protein S1 [Bacteroidota bacterium]
MEEKQKNLNQSNEGAEKKEASKTEESKGNIPKDEKPAIKEEVKEETPKQETKEELPKQEEQKGSKKEEEEKEWEKKEAKEIKEEKVEEIVEQEEEFDWDKFEEDDNVSDYDSEEKAKLEKLYTETLNVIKEHELIKAKVEHITEKDVILNIGYKSDGLVPFSEFKNNPDLKVGDEVEVLVESIEGQDGQLVLSYRKALAENAWRRIEKIHETGEVVQGHIKDRTKGGMVVDLFGLDSFLPGSQLDIKPVKDYDSYVGKDIDLRVVKLNPAFRNIVVSHKAIIEQDIEEQRHKILSKLEKGQVLEGIVKNLTSFGVFVDLGGVDGLIHITDVSWGRINHPNELLEIGQKINVVVLDYDEDKKRISLGMKQLTEHPWETLPKDIVEGSVLKGKIVNIEDYGAFVEIFPGVEGLVHVSEMTWSQHLKSPSDYIALHQEVEVKVLTISREDRKLSLGLKQLTEDPWKKIGEKYPKETNITTEVKNITNFGLFVELEEGVDGLIHISDLSWTKKINHPSEFAKVADKIECVVLEIDIENRRLSLGHKQIEEDPWETFRDIFEIGTVHECSVARIDEKGATITLPYNIEGYAPAKHLLKEDNSKIKEDDVLVFMIIEVDRNNRKITVSHTRTWKEAIKAQKDKEYAKKKKEADSTRKTLRGVKSKVKKTTLGSEQDVLKELKDKMIAEENKQKNKKTAKPKEKKKDDKEENE